MNNSIHKSVKKTFFFALILSIFFVAGIPILIIGATKMPTPLGIFMFVSGIVMLVLGFYGSPLAWIRYGHLRKLKNIWLMIAEDNIYSLEILANQFASKVETMKSLVNELITKRYLKSYTIQDNFIVRLVNTEQMQKTQAEIVQGVDVVACSSCGSKNILRGKTGRCEYCGSPLIAD